MSGNRMHDVGYMLPLVVLPFIMRRRGWSLLVDDWHVLEGLVQSDGRPVSISRLAPVRLFFQNLEVVVGKSVLAERKVGNGEIPIADMLNLTIFLLSVDSVAAFPA